MNFLIDLQEPISWMDPIIHMQDMTDIMERLLHSTWMGMVVE